MAKRKEKQAYAIMDGESVIAIATSKSGLADAFHDIAIYSEMTIAEIKRMYSVESAPLYM